MSAGTSLLKTAALTEDTQYPQDNNETPINRAAELTQRTCVRGRVAMAPILRALAVKPGDDVLVQAFTCIAVPEAVFSVGARPRYVHVALGSPNMDAADLKEKIRSDTKAVVIQHSFGLPADVHALSNITAAAEIPMEI